MQAFPEEFRRGFKVYDFGFYLHNEDFDGEYPAVFEQVKSKIESPYYLLFGKQTDSTGVYTKIWVAVKVPETSIFTCTDENMLLNIRDEIEVFTEIVYSSSSRIPVNYYIAEIEGMKRLEKYIQNQYDCCDITNRNGSSCGSCLKLDDAKSILVLQGYSSHSGFSLSSYTYGESNSDIFEYNGEVIIVDNQDSKSINLNYELDHKCPK